MQRPPLIGHSVDREDDVDERCVMQAGTQWWIGLDSWVLQDGNYTDFAVGQRRQFALEFGYLRSRRLQHTQARQTSVRHSGSGTTHAVTGELLQAPRDREMVLFILDFGLLAYDRQMVLDDLEPPPVGSWLEGEISLHVDHFIYMDHFGPRGLAPALIYTWRIDDIQIDTSPIIWIDASHPDYVGPDEGPEPRRDRDRESWRSVRRTQTHEYGGGYRLLCTLLGSEPVSTMAATGRRKPHGPLPHRWLRRPLAPKITRGVSPVS